MTDIRKCPECGNLATADFVDIGVGMQQCSPFSCESCNWVEAKEDAWVASAEATEDKFYQTVSDVVTAGVAVTCNKHNKPLLKDCVGNQIDTCQDCVDEILGFDVEDDNGGGGSTSVYKFKITCSCRKCGEVETEEGFLVFRHPFDIALREVGAAINAARAYQQGWILGATEKTYDVQIFIGAIQPYNKDTQ